MLFCKKIISNHSLKTEVADVSKTGEYQVGHPKHGTRFEPKPSEIHRLSCQE